MGYAVSNMCARPVTRHNQLYTRAPSLRAMGHRRTWVMRTTTCKKELGLWDIEERELWGSISWKKELGLWDIEESELWAPGTSKKDCEVRNFRKEAECDITRELSFNGMLANRSLQSVMVSLKVSNVPSYY
jgi:hypothetical protein